jgi:daunorubicin/doxorubicin transport system ATP-binding protein
MEASIPSPAGPAIETSGLTKAFGATRALDGIDLHVPSGSVYGLLGPNGAGKTTAVRILATLLRPDAGTARVAGRDVVLEADGVRARIALTGQFASLDNDLSGRENLVLLGRLLGGSRGGAKRRAGELLEEFDLEAAADRQVSAYSGGMRRRLDIAACLLTRPEVLFLDEPTTGLDPRSRRQVWDIVRSLTGCGTTVLLTTQYLEEADKLSDRIAVIDHGRLIAEGRPEELKAAAGSAALRVRLRREDRRDAAREILQRALDVPVELGPEPGVLAARVGEAERAVRALAELDRERIEVSELALSPPSLDEVFMALTGRPPDLPTTETKEAA